MGYTADSIQTSAPVIIRPERYKDMVAALHTAEAESNIGGHISWCEPLSVYENRHEDADMPVRHERIIREVLEHYGFGMGDRTDVIELAYWGGDKIGSSWDPIWNALGTVVTDEAEWIMRGEDGSMWAERVGFGNGRTQHGVSWTVDA